MASLKGIADKAFEAALKTADENGIDHEDDKFSDYYAEAIMAEVQALSPKDLVALPSIKDIKDALISVDEWDGTVQDLLVEAVTIAVIS